MLIGAYRDNEVDAAHPLMRKLEAIRKAGAPVREICLRRSSHEDLGQLIADALRCDPAHAAPLAQLVAREDRRQSVLRDSVFSRARRRGLAPLRS